MQDESQSQGNIERVEREYEGFIRYGILEECE